MNVKKSLIMAALGVLLAVVSWAGASGETDFGADEDAFVKKSNDPNSNYNGEELRVKAGGSEINSYLKFTVSGVGTVTNAILKLYSEDVEMGVDVYEAASNEWSESIITWNTAPGSTGGSLDHVAVTTGWVEFDVTSLVTGDGTYSFVLKGDTAASTRNFSSSEGANPPVLTINEPWVDLTAPVISALSPADDESNVTVGSNLEVTFDENIAVGSGNITIKNLTDSNETIIPVTDAAQVSVAGSLLTIDPTANLDYLKDYAILIDAGAVEDPCSNLFAGITDEATWNFTTRESDFIAPAILGLTPADDANNAVVGADLAATFDENIVIAAGNITIKNLTDSNQIVIPVTDAAQVYVYGEVLMINPTNDLVASKEYAVWIDAGAIEDEAGNSFAGIAD
ncbi:MAG: Ig-like domain-containing protein, partial [Planctomycetes bacterium]|nr:Ig-like domain-containing protein [Planctomycetota bacterium]